MTEAPGGYYDHNLPDQNTIDPYYKCYFQKLEGIMDYSVTINDQFKHLGKNFIDNIKIIKGLYIARGSLMFMLSSEIVNFQIKYLNVTKTIYKKLHDYNKNELDDMIQDYIIFQEFLTSLFSYEKIQIDEFKTTNQDIYNLIVIIKDIINNSKQPSLILSDFIYGIIRDNSGSLNDLKIKSKKIFNNDQ